MSKVVAARVGRFALHVFAWVLGDIGVARGGPEWSPANEKKNIKASLVNLTLNMRYKNDKNIKFVITRFVFPSSTQNAPKSVFVRPDPAGEAYDAPPDPLVGWGGAYPLTIPLPTRRLRRLELGARTRRLRSLGSQAPFNTKSWLRHCLG